MTASTQTSRFSSPTPALKAFAPGFWQSDRNNFRFNCETIIPKGSAEIIFNLEERDIEANIGGKGYQLPKCFLSANHTMPIRVSIPERQIFFGVMLTPSTVRNLFRTKASEFANQCVDLTIVDSAFDSLWHQLMEETSFEKRVDTLSAWITRRLRAKDSYDQMFDAYLSDDYDVAISAADLSRTLCYSPRHVSRKLHELTGMNTEQNLLFRKYLKSVRLMDNSKLTLTEIAHACHFTDQSHFIKTFKSFAHVTPGEYRKTKSFLSCHIFENVR